MKDTVLGLHHITAIASDAQRNYDFYTKVMGLRLVKKTVNFDDPGTYHFYFGDEVGTPGTILTFFPWEHIKKGYPGTGMATEIAFAIPAGSLGFWKDRFERKRVKHGDYEERFGERFLSFEDPDGLILSLVEPAVEDKRQPWVSDDITADIATRGFHAVTLSLKSIQLTSEILTDILGYKIIAQDGHRYRFATDAVNCASIVDLLADPDGKPGSVMGGTNHHVAFRVKNEEVLMEYRKRVTEHGLNITPKIDRNYFYSLYFREPGGVLFELATDNPGFPVDEPVSELGTHLKLPPQYEPRRADIERVLPRIIE
ncbi:ring-cleaving dioxygenase [Chitinophaga caeni]|uniref:Ring-cleaving dioxygenase n=1 Tax=Chitinophaga caeni TaxID=2029983 RepID=A0A291QPQ5_9BACT|nr:ring-cleaving dioxygenase [Chitinophaga caeni]ATL45883.1 ring-cleaving dioxygenase [Chitinophaga caeni]